MDVTNCVIAVIVEWHSQVWKHENMAHLNNVTMHVVPRKPFFKSFKEFWSIRFRILKKTWKAGFLDICWGCWAINKRYFYVLTYVGRSSNILHSVPNILWLFLMMLKSPYSNYINWLVENRSLNRWTSDVSLNDSGTRMVIGENFSEIF